MKNYLLRIIFILIILFNKQQTLKSQNEEDALNISYTYYLGTSRGLATGNALTSIIADQSAIIKNPASLGKYVKSELAFTPYVSFAYTSSEFYNKDNFDFKLSFKVSNFGIVLSHKNDENSDFKYVNFSFSYNRLIDYNKYVKISGYNSESSLVDYFVKISEGKKPNELNPFVEGMGYDAWLFDYDSSSNKYYSALLGNGVNQIKQINYKGGIGEYNFSLATNFLNTIFLGCGIGIRKARFITFSDYSEKDPKEIDAIKFFEYFTYSKEIEHIGKGINFKIGAIFAPVNFFRLGLSFHSPTFYDLDLDYSFKIKSKFSDTMDYRTSDIKPRVGEYDYQVITPFKAIGSLGFLIPKDNKPFINIGIEGEIINYKHIRLRANDYFFEDENDAINNIYSLAWSSGAGIEFFLYPFVFRISHNYYLSPYSSNQPNKNSHTQLYAGGIGFIFENSYWDLSFGIIQKKYKEFLYDPNLIPIEPAYMKYMSMFLLTTIGIRF